MRTSIRFRQRNHEWKDEVVEKERAMCIGGERRVRMDFVDAGAEIERDSRFNKPPLVPFPECPCKLPMIRFLLVYKPFNRLGKSI